MAESVVAAQYVTTENGEYIQDEDGNVLAQTKGKLMA